MFRALALSQSALETLYDSQFTLTQLIKPNYHVVPHTDAAPPLL